jgi:hypothetical protein
MHEFSRSVDQELGSLSSSATPLLRDFKSGSLQSSQVAVYSRVKHVRRRVRGYETVWYPSEGSDTSFG